MINPARFAQNYTIGVNSIKPHPKAIREGSVKVLAEKAKAVVKTTQTPKFKGKPLPL